MSQGAAASSARASPFVTSVPVPVEHIGMQPPQSRRGRQSLTGSRGSQPLGPLVTMPSPPAAGALTERLSATFRQRVLPEPSEHNEFLQAQRASSSRSATPSRPQMRCQTPPRVVQGMTGPVRSAMPVRSVTPPRVALCTALPAHTVLSRTPALSAVRDTSMPTLRAMPGIFGSQLEGSGPPMMPSAGSLRAPVVTVQNTVPEVSRAAGTQRVPAHRRFSKTPRSSSLSAGGKARLGETVDVVRPTHVAGAAPEIPGTNTADYI